MKGVISKERNGKKKKRREERREERREGDEKEKVRHIKSNSWERNGWEKDREDTEVGCKICSVMLDIQL